MGKRHQDKQGKSQRGDKGEQNSPGTVCEYVSGPTTVYSNVGDLGENFQHLSHHFQRMVQGFPTFLTLSFHGRGLYRVVMDGPSRRIRVSALKHSKLLRFNWIGVSGWVTTEDWVKLEYHTRTQLRGFFEEPFFFCQEHRVRFWLERTG